MSIDSIVNNSWYTSPLLDNNKEEEESLLEQLAGERSKKNTETAEALSPGRKLLQAASEASDAISSMRQNGTPITKEGVDSEIQRKEMEFQMIVSASLRALGVDEDIEFKIALDENGNLVAEGDHPDIDKVQKFFDENPELAEEFKSIESLKNFRKNMDTAPMSSTSLRRSLQLENMNAYFQGMEEGQNSYSPLIMSYANNSLLALSGINLSV